MGGRWGDRVSSDPTSDTETLLNLGPLLRCQSTINQSGSVSCPTAGRLDVTNHDLCSIRDRVRIAIVIPTESPFLSEAEAQQVHHQRSL